MSSRVSRRQILGWGAAGAAAGLVGLPQGVFAGRAPAGKTAKNIVFCVSDGMSTGVASMLDLWLQRTKGETAYWTRLMNTPGAVNGQQDTRSLSSLVTDSAAASSAWGSGRHVWNGMINEFPDGTKLRTLVETLKTEAKMRAGMVTTSTITHATPAGAAVTTPRRDDEDTIAEKYLALGVDVLMGGGDRFFNPEKRADKRDLYADYAKAGYTVAKDRAGVLRAREGKFLGVFSDGHVPYTVDRMNSEAVQQQVPTLREMAEKAVQLLKGSPEGFFLQVEAARVDHAAHSNDFAGAVFDQLAFDEAVQAMVEWATEDGETLVIVTSDHGNSNPGLIGAGPEYFYSTAGLMTLGEMKASYSTILGLLGATPTTEAIQAVVEDRLGLTLDEDQAALVKSGFDRTSPLSKVEEYSLPQSHLSLALSGHTHVCWSGRQHSNDYTIVTAFGPGAEAFTGLTTNVSFFEKLLAHRDLRVENPTMSFEEAKRLMDQRREGQLIAAVTDHWL